MSSIAWQMEYTVETNASVEFAWKYWSNVANWNDPPAKFELDRPFADGARGTTWVPGQAPLHWLVRDVAAPNAATIELGLDGAMLRFAWRLEAVAAERTRLVQHIVLSGEKADMYVGHVECGFGGNMGDGMNKLAKLIENAYANVAGEGRREKI